MAKKAKAQPGEPGPLPSYDPAATYRVTVRRPFKRGVTMFIPRDSYLLRGDVVAEIAEDVTSAVRIA